MNLLSFFRANGFQITGRIVGPTEGKGPAVIARDRECVVLATTAAKDARTLERARKEGAWLSYGCRT